MRIWRHRLTKLAGLGRSDLADLIRAQWQLVWALVLLRVVPRGRLLRVEGWAELPGHPGREVEALARRLALAVSRAAEHGLFRPTCLVRAVALAGLLRGRGIQEGRVRVGVRVRGGGFAAHAWVELGDLILGDEEWHVRTFTPVRSVYPVA